MKRHVAHIVVLVVLILGGLGLGASFLFVASFSNLAGSQEKLEGNFGSSAGIYEITRTDEEAVKGLPSTTVKFKIAANSGDMSNALDTVGEYLERQAKNGSTQLVNVDATSDDEDDPIGFRFNASSPLDYVDGTYSNAISDFRQAQEVNKSRFTAITYVSLPTTTGVRTVTLQAQSGSEGTNDEDILNSDWNALVTLAGAYPFNGTSYQVQLTTPGVNQVIMDGLMYDENSRQLLATLDPAVFTTLVAYQEGSTEFKTIQFTADATVGSNSSRFLITLPGDQPDAAGVASAVTNFTNTFYYKELGVLLPSVYTTILRYENSTEAVYVSYPTNETIN